MDFEEYKANTKYAFCTLVMRGDSYVRAALIMGYSLKNVSDMDRIVMVTDDVSPKCVTLLQGVFTHVITVSYRQYESKPFIVSTPEQRKRYAAWIDAIYTKWNLVGFVQYEKILFLDADTIVIRNIDSVFEFDTPAGIFTNPWVKTYFKRGFYDFYRHLKIGEKIPHKVIDHGLQRRGSVVFGSCVLVSPSEDDYKKLFTMLEENQPFGFTTTRSGNDEQAITYYYRTQNKEWTMLPPNLNTIPWKIHLLHNQAVVDCVDVDDLGDAITEEERKHESSHITKCEMMKHEAPLVVHYFGSDKVWNSDPTKPSGGDQWDDIYTWWQLAYNYICLSGHSSAVVKRLKEMFNLTETIKKICKTGISVGGKCFYCEWLINEGPKYNWYVDDVDSSHPMIDKHNKLVCPLV